MTAQNNRINGKLMNKTKKITIILFLILALICFTGAVMALEEGEGNNNVVDVETANELILALQDSSVTGITLKSDIPDLNTDIKFGNNIETFVPNNHTVTLVGSKETRIKVTVANNGLLNTIVGCFIGNGSILDNSGNIYHIIYLGKSGNGVIIRDSKIVEPGYIYVNEGAKAIVNTTNDELTISDVLGNSGITTSVTYKPQAKSESEFKHWDTDGSEMIKGVEYAITSSTSKFTAYFSVDPSDAVTLFYSQIFASSETILPGHYTQKGGSGFFDVNDSKYNFIPYKDKEGKTPPGIYYYMGKEEGVPINVQVASLTEDSGLYIYDEGSGEYKRIDKDIGYDEDVAAFIGYNADIIAKLSFKKTGTEEYYSKLGGDITTVIPGHDIHFVPGKQEDKCIGKWEVYADFSESMESKEKSVTHVLIGTINVTSTTGKSATVKISKSEVLDGETFNIEITGPENARVYVKYYESGAGKTYANDAKNVDENTEIAYSRPKSQERYFDDQKKAEEAGIKNWKGEGFYTDKNGKVTINMKGNTGDLINKSFVIGVVVEGCSSGNKGSFGNPYTVNVTIKGATFKVELDKSSYSQGENIRASGTYSGDSISLHFYLEGTNESMVKLQVAKKDNGNDDDYSVEGGKFYYVLNGFTLSTWNPGTYTFYATRFDASSTSEESGNYSEETRKKIVTNAVSHTITLVESPITFKEIDNNVQAGITTANKSRYLTIKVKSPAANAISLYILGNNKMYYINGEEALAKGYVKNLNRDDNSSSYSEYYYNYLFKTDEGWEYSNPYYFIGKDGSNEFGDSSLRKVLEKLGQYVPYSYDIEKKEYDYRWYPNYLIIDERATPKSETGESPDWTYTIYIHIQEPNELTATTVKASDGTIQTSVESREEHFPDEKLNNTAFDDGEYYIILQHPMSDNIFNTIAGIAKGPEYNSGINVYTNGNLVFNIPATENLTAVKELMNTIKAGNDTCVGTTIYVISDSNSKQKISEVKNSYGQGDIIEITIDNPDYIDIFGTLEENEFTLENKNINYVKTFAVRDTESQDVIVKTKLTLDTSETPLGTYQIILKGKKNEESPYKVFSTYSVKVVEKQKEDEKVVEGDDDDDDKYEVHYIPEKETEKTKSPVPIVGILAGIAFAITLKRR